MCVSVSKCVRVSVSKCVHVRMRFFSVACIKVSLYHSLLVKIACGWALEIALSTLYYLVWFVLQVCRSKMVPSMVVKLLT